LLLHTLWGSMQLLLFPPSFWDYCDLIIIT
jgi:hypothetical protein